MSEQVKKLRALIDQRLKEIDELKAKAVDDEGNPCEFTEEQSTELSKLLDKVDETTAQIELLERESKQRAKIAKPIDDPADDEDVTQKGADGQTRAKDLTPDLTAAKKLGLICSTLLQTKMDPSRSAADRLDKAGYMQLAKTLVSNVDAQGGFTVPTILMDEIIELLRPQTVILRGNPRRLPMPDGNLSLPAGSTGASATYGAEATKIDVTEPTFREVNLSAKRLGAIVPMSVELMQYSLPDVEAFVQDDLVSALGETMDLEMLLGDGSANGPVGIRNLLTTTPVPSTGVTHALVNSELGKVELAMLNANIRMRRVAWVMSKRSEVFLRDLLNDQGTAAFPTMSDANPSLKGHPVFSTTQMPNNLGGGTNESEIMLIDYDNVMIGDTTRLSLSVSTEGTIDNGGTQVSAFQNDLAFLKAVMRHDINVRHTETAAVMTGVTYGA